jgi:hypothetical protein
MMISSEVECMRDDGLKIKPRVSKAETGGASGGNGSHHWPQTKSSLASDRNNRTVIRGVGLLETCL